VTGPPSRSPVKVLFIAGAGRSGSTLLEMILGQVAEVVSIGELRYIWERGFVENRRCGCGRPFSGCEFWSPVVTDALGSPARVDPREMIDVQGRATRIRQLPRILSGADAPTADRKEPYLRAMESLYRTIRDRTASHVVVDSSKLPTFGHLVDQLDGVDLSILHLIRDPRATAHSWLRTRELPDRPGVMMQRMSPAKSASLWSLWNRTTERLWAKRRDRYLRIRYEDLVADPEPIVRRILSFAQEEPRALPFVSPHEVRLEPTHSVAGNPSRFRTGQIEIRADEEWRTALSASDRRLVELIAGPMMHRYGYRRGPRDASSSAPASA
jgi:hypothetical protein